MNQDPKQRWADKTSHPPSVRMTTLEEPPIWEPMPMVGWVDAEKSDEETLLKYAICLDYAAWDRETERWERCLFSVPTLETLLELYDAGEFPFLLEAALSLAEAEWRLAAARGDLERPAVPRWRYLEAAPPEMLMRVGRLERASSHMPQLRILKGGKSD